MRDKPFEFSEQDCWGEDITERIQYLESLKDGWDGHQSSKPTPQVIVHLKSVLYELYHNISDEIPNPVIGPTWDGGIDLEWPDIGLFCTFTHNVVNIYKQKNDREKDYELPKDLEKIKRLILEYIFDQK